MWTRTKKSGFRIQDSGYNPPQSPLVKRGSKGGYRASCILYLASLLLFANSAFAEELKLQPLIDEALKNNHELIASGLKVNTSKYKIPQAGSLPDPMFMLGYQNEGYDRFNYGKSPDAQWMYSASQTFLFPENSH